MTMKKYVELGCKRRKGEREAAHVTTVYEYMKGNMTDGEREI